MTLQHVLLGLSFCAAAKGGAPLPISGSTCGRRYDGIGGLSNSCAAWLLAYNETVRGHIMDVLFKPRWAGSAQVLKLEIGGDAHSTINTESSFMHVEDPSAASFNRGWETYIALEAKKRNPQIVLGGLAWGWPGWTAGSLPKKIAYLVAWVDGMQREKNLTIDYIGLQNEGDITGGSEAASVALRVALDAAGYHRTAIECCDAHNFEGLPTNRSSDFYKAVDTYGIHEPLRSAESVPPQYSATGKPIWSSESYTTYSDSNGGGCWARALNWGYVKGNVTSHTAWNLIQSYPSVGDDMNYDGHGLMWAEQPWSGFYTVNSPIWAMAHYTQATAVGWRYLPHGQGSGMLPSGGSYVSLVSPGGCGGELPSYEAPIELTIVLQTMAWNLSQCFKDTHPEFSVAAVANVSFELDSATLASLSRGRSSGGAISIYARRTRLREDSVVLPTHRVAKEERTNRYFEAVPMAPLETTGPRAGRIDLALRVNEVWTISTVLGAGSRGDDSPGPDLGLAPINPPRLWQEAFSGDAAGAGRGTCVPLTGHPIDTPLTRAIVAIDQQGVWEARASSSSSSSSAPTTTMQQVVPELPDEWHHGCGKHPYSFVGPAANLTASSAEGAGGTVSCDVLPSTAAGGWAGIGFGRPASKTAPEELALKVFANGSWSYAGQRGALAARSSSGGWRALSLSVAVGGSAAAFETSSASEYVATIDGVVVARGSTWAHTPPSATNSFATLSSSFSAGGANSEFKNLCIDVVATEIPSVAPGPAPTPPGPSPGPAPPAPAARGVAWLDSSCAASPRPSDLWTFSGEDRGEAGSLIPSINTSLCLDLDGGVAGDEVQLVQCATDPASAAYRAQRWYYDAPSAPQSFSSVDTRPCRVASHGEQCHFCLDVKGHSTASLVIDFYDCKLGDANQQWAFDVAAGEGAVAASGKGMRCLAATA